MGVILINTTVINIATASHFQWNDVPPQEESQYNVSKKKKESEISSPYTRVVVQATAHIRCSIATSQVVTDNPFMLVRKGEEREILKAEMKGGDLASPITSRFGNRINFSINYRS